jgi:hypothetical protein
MKILIYDDTIKECDIPDGAVCQFEISDRIFYGKKDGSIFWTGDKGYGIDSCSNIEILHIAGYQKMWIATDEDGYQYIYINPKRKNKKVWEDEEIDAGYYMDLPIKIDQTWQDEPREIWVKLHPPLDNN